MCRLLGIVASEPTEFGLVLTGAPRCLATLSREHPDGWGIAIHDADPDNGQPWRVDKGTERAYADRRFHEIAAGRRGHLLLAHIRQKTVGPTRIENTHPFARAGWVFAHNGTVERTDVLRIGTSRARLEEISGETDSELLFAHLLTCLDDYGVTYWKSQAQLEAATKALAVACEKLRAAAIGAFNFLLSDGRTCFAHRMGRSLFMLERGPADPVRERREVVAGAEIRTRWTSRRQAIFVASERITDEPWCEIADGTLLRIDRQPVPVVAYGPGRRALTTDSRPAFPPSESVAGIVRMPSGRVA